MNSETKEKKVLLLDIDFTTFYNVTPRPYLIEFLRKMAECYQLRFYTAAERIRVTEVCRVLYHQYGVDDKWLRDLNNYSLCRQNCPMIQHGNIEIKCLRRAAKALCVSYNDIAFLLDDMPMHDNPDQEKRIQVPGFWGQEDDMFL